MKEPLLKQEGLVDVFQSVSLFPERCRKRLNPHRPAVELIDDRQKELSVQGIESPFVDFKKLKRFASQFASNPGTVAPNLRKVANPFQQAGAWPARRTERARATNASAL